jgi:hypothetical protein
MWWERLERRIRAAKRGRQPWRISDRKAGDPRPYVCRPCSGLGKITSATRAGLRGGPPGQERSPSASAVALLAKKCNKSRVDRTMLMARGALSGSGARQAPVVVAGAETMLVTGVWSLIVPTLTCRPLVTDCGVVVDTTTLNHFFRIPTDFAAIRRSAPRIDPLHRL